MKQRLADYFAFTKKERRGVFVLLAIIFLCLLFPYILQNHFTNIREPTDEKILAQLALLEFKKDTAAIFSKDEFRFKERGDTENNFMDFSKKWSSYSNPVKGELFYFDPNTLSQSGWEKLGVRSKTAATIQNYIQKGGRFRKAEDLTKIYGLSEYMVERLIPYVQIAGIEKEQNETNAFTNYKWDKRTPVKLADPSDKMRIKEQFLKEYRIDINTADTAAWSKLPGIGTKLSARINSFRDKLGGFYRIEQVAETFGLPDSTFQKIRNNLVCSPNSLQKLNINGATIQHPYIPKNLANNILQYRIQHGNYKNINELKKLALFDEGVFQKILPYIIAE